MPEEAKIGEGISQRCAVNAEEQGGAASVGDLSQKKGQQGEQRKAEHHRSVVADHEFFQ